MNLSRFVRDLIRKAKRRRPVSSVRHDVRGDVDLLCRRFVPASGSAMATEMDSTAEEVSVKRNLGSIVVVLVDVWDDHQTAGFRRRMEENIAQRLLPLLRAVRRCSTRVVHASHGRKEHGLVQVCPGDLVLAPRTSGDEFSDILAGFACDTLLYAGYASNWCVLYRPVGIVEMSRRGFCTILVRDASIGYEMPDTLCGQYAHSVAVNMVEAQFGYSTTVRDVETALSSCKCCVRE